MTQQDITIRRVERADLPLLDQALRALSADLGDPHPADIALLEQAGFGPTPAYYALIAENGEAGLCGAAMYSPVMSTTLAAPGVFVSDLWVEKSARGTGLGRRLLAQVAQDAGTRWNAGCLKLAVYHDASGARRFYDQLGFGARTDETTMLLDRPAFEVLKGQR